MKHFYGNIVNDNVYKILMMCLSDKSNAKWCKENEIAEIEYDDLYVNHSLSREQMDKLFEKTIEWFSNIAKETKYSDEVTTEDLYFV